MLFIFIRQVQDAIGAVDVLRNDPLLYLVVVLPLLGVMGMGWLLKLKSAELKESNDEKKELRAENAALVKSMMESQKATTEAVTLQVEVMRALRVDFRDNMGKYDQKVEMIKTQHGEIIKHLLEIKMRKAT